MFSRNTKYLGINLIKEVKYFYTEICKTEKNGGLFCIQGLDSSLLQR